MSCDHCPSYVCDVLDTTMPFSSLTRVDSTSLMAGIAADFPVRRQPVQDFHRGDEEDSFSATESLDEAEQQAAPTAVGTNETTNVRPGRSFTGVTHGMTLSNVIAAYRDF